MRDGQEVSEGEKIATDLLQRLGVSQQDLVTGAYMDLLLQQEHSSLIQQQQEELRETQIYCRMLQGRGDTAPL